MNDLYLKYLSRLRDDYTICVKMEFLHPDNTVAFEITEDVILNGSTINVVYQNGQRRSASINVDNWANTYDFNINKVWFGQAIKISAGVYLKDGTPYYFPQGVYYINNPSEVFNPGNRTTTFNLVDKWSYLDGTLFGGYSGIYKLLAKNNLFTAIEQLLLTDRGNGMPLDSVPPLLSSYYLNKVVTIDGVDYPVLDCPYDDKITGNYANVLNSIGTMLVANMGYDANGQLRVESANIDVIQDNMRQILWEFSTNEREFIGMTDNPQPGKMYNNIVVTGGTLMGHIAYGEATNNDPSSPTNVSIIGKKTYVEERAKYYADSQCQELADTLLNQYKNLSSTVTIQSVPMFHLQERSLVTVYREGKDFSPVPYLINGWTLPIGNGVMSINATKLNPARDFRFMEPTTTYHFLNGQQLNTLRL